MEAVSAGVFGLVLAMVAAWDATWSEVARQATGGGASDYAGAAVIVAHGPVEVRPGVGGAPMTILPDMVARASAAARRRRACCRGRSARRW